MTQNIKEVNGVLVKPRGTLASKALTINHHKGMSLFVDNRTGLAHGVTAELSQVFNVSTAGVITAASFSGNINASNLNTGTVPNARISGTYTGLTNLTGTGNVDFARFIGNAGDTVAAPSITWTGDLNTGIYRPGTSQVAITTGGAQRALFNSSGVSFSGTTTVSGDINGTSATFSIKASGTDVFRMSGVNPVISTKSTGTIYLRPNGSSSSVNEVTINSAGIKVGTTNVSLDGHTHSYLPLSGGTLTGNLQVTGSTLRYGKTYTKYFNSVSTESNSRNEIRIPMYSTSGAMFLNIEASVDTTSVGTEYYIKKNFRLRNYHGQSVGTIYGQSTNVIETYGDHYYHIGDAEPDTVNQMWIIPIYSSNNRQVSVKMTA